MGGIIAAGLFYPSLHSCANVGYDVALLNIKNLKLLVSINPVMHNKCIIHFKFNMYTYLQFFAVVKPEPKGMSLTWPKTGFYFHLQIEGATAIFHMEK